MYVSTYTYMYVRIQITVSLETSGARCGAGGAIQPDRRGGWLLNLKVAKPSDMREGRG